jgi:hypothetical protein
MMQGDGQFDNPKTRAQMSTRAGHRGDCLGSHLVSYTFEVWYIEAAEVF